MVIITIFGVGFGEVKPINTPSLRAFTMLVIVCGTTSAVYEEVLYQRCRALIKRPEWIRGYTQYHWWPVDLI
jgi:hypothetical protein